MGKCVAIGDICSCSVYTYTSTKLNVLASIVDKYIQSSRRLKSFGFGAYKNILHLYIFTKSLICRLVLFTRTNIGY